MTGGADAGAIGREVGGRVDSAGAAHVSSHALFQGRREIVIVHRGQEYRLRITRMDKLILTK
jgi:hemin uptake protein HemP